MFEKIWLEHRATVFIWESISINQDPLICGGASNEAQTSRVITQVSFQLREMAVFLPADRSAISLHVLLCALHPSKDISNRLL